MARNSVQPRNKADVALTNASLGRAGSAASTTAYGTVKQAVLVPGAAGANPTQAEFAALLTALKNAGIMSST